MSTPSEEPAHELIEPQMVCDACGRFTMTGTEWHSISVTHTREECSTGEGAGYWVCEDCHLIIHDWMEDHPEVEDAAKEGFYRIIKGLAAVIEQGPRKYRRTVTHQS